MMLLKWRSSVSYPLDKIDDRLSVRRSLTVGNESKTISKEELPLRVLYLYISNIRNYNKAQKP